MLYQINNGAVMYGADTILHNIYFEIRNTEKIAVIGRNGCGKTTLLKLISGEIELTKRDSDEDIFIAKAGNPQIGYLKQIAFKDDTISLETEVMKVFEPIKEMQRQMDSMVALMDQDPSEKIVKSYTALQEQFNYLGGYYYEKEYEIVLKKFGFTEEDKKKPLSDFSGGQRTKIAFVKLLLEKPDILLLDEPTNHLDIETVEWLEDYLKDYPRSVVIVSHDRMFLDKIVSIVYEIEYGTAKRYSGNYTAFMQQKRLNWDKQKKDYEAQQKEIARLNEIVIKFKNKPTKVAMTRSKLKAIEHMEKIECPDRYDTKAFHATFVPLRETGKDVLRIEKLKIGYDKPLATVSLDMKKGQRIGIVGGNGIGKSTFLKTLVGKLDALGGEFRYGVNVDVGYFDQQMAQYTSEKQVINELWDEFPTMTQTEVRNALGAFLFSGDDVFKQVDMLSGGERVRLALAKIFRKGPNFLILDEPTNHMDIVGKETLESMLKDFDGSVVFVSHDRYFIQQVATQLLVFEKEGVTYYPFGYEEYANSKRTNTLTDSHIDRKNVVTKIDTKQGMTKSDTSASDTEVKTEKGYYNPGREQAKLDRKMQKTEEQIAATEALLATKKDELQNPEYATNYQKLSEIQGEIDTLENTILELMEQWSTLEQEKK